MNISDVTKLAEETAKKYNLEGASPFPFENILNENKDLVIYYTDLKESTSSGAIILSEGKFYILINKNKPKVRQYFTTAHELGHYFLHKETLKGEEALVDGESTLDSGNMLYRMDNLEERNRVETEANNFAASLIMPEALVRKAWETIHDVEECAKIFNVSILAMTIRLERLGLLD